VTDIACVACCVASCVASCVTDIDYVASCVTDIACVTLVLCRSSGGVSWKLQSALQF